MSVGERYAASPRDGALDLDGWLERLRGWAAPRQGRLGLLGCVVCAVVIALCADQTDLLLPQSIRPVPAAMAGLFGAHGVDLGMAGVILVIAAMFFSYVATVAAWQQLSGPLVWSAIVLVNGLVLLGPPLISTDVFSYIAYGRLGAIYHANPYLYGPSAIALDPLYPFIGSQWVSTPTAYGPLFTGLSYLLTPLGIASGVLAYKAIGAFSCALVLAVSWHAARLRGFHPVKAVALVGLNPITVVYGLGGGHNDLLMLAAMMLGLWALLLRRRAAGGGLLVIGAAIKLTAGVMLPFALARDAAAARGRERRALLAGAAFAGAGALALSIVLFGAGPLHLAVTLASIQAKGGVHSIPGLVLTVLGLGGAGAIVGAVLDVATLVFIAWLVRRVWRGELDWIEGAAWAMVALLITAGLLLPWYVSWLVPLAAISRERRLTVAMLLLTAACLTTL